MSNRASAINPPTSAKSQLNLRIDSETRRLLELAASHEGRSMSSVLDDAIKLYFRQRSEGYRVYLDAARRFLDAPEGSEEKALAGAVLSAGLSRDGGRMPQERGGDAAAVRARMRQRQRPLSES